MFCQEKICETSGKSINFLKKSVNHQKIAINFVSGAPANSTGPRYLAREQRGCQKSDPQQQ